jgi:hypothetical protein
MAFTSRKMELMASFMRTKGEPMEVIRPDEIIELALKINLLTIFSGRVLWIAG